MPFPSVPLRDNFTRSNEGPPPSASWVTSRSTGWKVESNLGVPDDNSNCGATWNTSFGPDMEVAVEIAQLQEVPVYVELNVRQQTNNDAASDHYEFDYFPNSGGSDDVFEMWKRVGGVFTQLGATITLGVGALAVGSVVGGRVAGTGLEMFLDGVSKGTRTDSDVSGAGYATITTEGVASTVAKFSEFYAGTVSTVVIPKFVHQYRRRRV